MLDLTASVDSPTRVLATPDTPAGVWRHSFPSADLVSAAAAMFTGHRLADRALGITLGGEVSSPSMVKGRELWPERYAGRLGAWETAMVEGPRWYVTVSPGTVAVRTSDPARADRTWERQERAAGRAARRGDSAEALARRALLAAAEVESSGGAVVREWSAKSRARMVQVLQSLDWHPLVDQGVPAMVTLTYPGDWLAVAPTAVESRRHLLMLRKRFERAWGTRLMGVWKREFQLRGAPHWHLLMVPPSTTLNGETFARWLSRVWAEVVGAAWCGSACWEDEPCCERGRHRLAGTGVDYAKGARSTDPRRIGVYFAKHGSFAAKEGQNLAPAEWVEQGSVGRFWGVWGLDRATAGVQVSPDEGVAALRLLRRHSRASAYVGRVPVWRHRTAVDPATGEVTAKWRRSTKAQRIYRLRNTRGGFVAVNDAPALAASVARGLDAQFRPPEHPPGTPRNLP